MIRIAFVSTLAYNYFFPGVLKQAGGHTRIYNLARAFARKPEYRVFCVTGDFGQPDQVVKDNVTLLKAPVDNPAAALKVLKCLLQLSPDILVDFCASPRLFLYYLLKKTIGLNYIFLTGHDNDVNGRYGTVENQAYDFFYRVGIRNADTIIAQVPYHKEVLRQKWHLDSHLVLSPYLEITPQKPVEKDIILWVGRAAYYKRPELFVRLAGHFPESKFVMICNRSRYDNGFIQKIEKGFFDFKNLVFHDYVPYPEMEKYYSRARFLVNTSDYEGFSNTFIEAAVHRTPVLSLNSDPNSMFSKHHCGFFCQGDAAKMAALFYRMLTEDDLVGKMGNNAFAYAFSYHRLDSAVSSIDRIVKSIVGRL